MGVSTATSEVFGGNAAFPSGLQVIRGRSLDIPFQATCSSLKLTGACFVSVMRPNYCYCGPYSIGFLLLRWTSSTVPFQ
jgi:hypothetical protein